MGRVILAAIIACLFGCGGSGGTYPVTGKVSFPDGSPLTSGTVLFEQSGEGKRVSSSGEIKNDGSFRLTTHKPGDGAPPGKYRAAVQSTPIPEEEAKTRKPPIDAKYEDLSTSGLEFTVEAKSNEFTITVTAPGKAKTKGSKAGP